MAENWKNNILPQPDSLDLGSLAYDDNTSLEEITQKYQNLGTEINNLTKAAADDVSTRQTKLIGNDFGGVNPMMYATYYQPNANDLQSAMRISGTEKALEEGMERGKAAAEADLASAKNAYSNAMDGYNSAKEAFANIKVAMVDSGMLPDNTDESEAQAYRNFSSDRETARAYGSKAYTDSQGVDWSDKDRWSNAVNATISEMGVDTTGWKQSDWDNFWSDKKVGRTFEYNYVSSYIKDNFGEEKYNAFVSSYNAVMNRVDQVFDYMNQLTDKLPESSSLELFYATENPNVELSSGGTIDQLLDYALSGKQTEEDRYSYTYAYFTQEKWIREHIAEEYQEEVLNKARQMTGNGQSAEDMANSEKSKRVKKMLEDNPKMSVPEATSKVVAELGKEYYEYLQSKIKKDEANANIVKREVGGGDLVKEMFGFDLIDMAWLTTWKKQNPDEYERYQNQLAMAYGKMDSIEVADGQKWYYTGCAENNGYEQLPAGTPVFFAPDGAINEDGSFRSDKLKAFIDIWKDYYSADVDKISKEELTSKQTALQDAYREYMGETSAVQMVNTVFNVKITKDVYNAVVATLADPGTSDTEIFGMKTSEFIKSFKDLAEKDGDAALRYLYGLTNSAYSNTKKFLRYSGMTDRLVYEDLNYKDDSDMKGESKLQWNQGGYKVPQFEPEDTEEAVAAFLVLTRSMEKYKAGSTQYNINPDFMRENSIVNIAKSWGSQAMGAIDFAVSMANLVAGTFAAPFNGWQAPAEFGGSFSFNNIVGSIFSGEREYGDNAWQQGELDIQADDKAREYAKSLVNPLLVDVYFGDKDFGDIKGVADNLSLEGKGMFGSPYSFGNFVVDMTGMMAVNLAEGQALQLLASGIGTLATKVNLKLLPAITEYKASLKAADTVGKGLSWVDNVDDPYLAANTARNTLMLDSIDDVNQIDTLGRTASGSLSVLDDSVNTANMASQTATNLLSRLDDISAYKDSFGILNRRAANALSSLNADDLEDLVRLYGKSANKVIDALDKVTDTAGLSADVQRGIRNFQSMSRQTVVLASGEQVSLAQASMVVAANRIMGTATLSAATGINAMQLAQLPDEARSFLLKTLNGISSADDGLVVNGSMNMFLRSMGPNDFKELARNTLERAVFNNEIGKAWDKFDTYRVLGQTGWTKSGMYALGREFLTDALTDPLRDFKRNIQVPRLNDEGDMKVQTIGEYFTDPGNLVQNLVFSSAHFAIGRIWNQYGAWHWNKEAHKAYDALKATDDMKSEAAIAALKRANDAANMAQQFSDKAWKVGMNYGRVMKYTEESNILLDKALDEVFKANNWDLDYGGKKKVFKTAEEYIRYMTNDKMPVKEGNYALMNSLALKAMNNFYLIKLQMGTRFGEFGNLSQQNYLRVWDRMRNTINENYGKFAGNGKDTMTNVHDFYTLIKNDLVSANDSGEFGIRIKHFEKSLDSYFNNLESWAKKGLESGFLPEVRYGYLPISSLYFDGSFDDMKISHENAATRGLLVKGNVIDVTAANPGAPRNLINLDNIIDAMLRGDKTYDVISESGEVIRTVQLDYDGLNPIDNTTMYFNNYNMHKYLDPLWGANVSDFSASLQNGNAYIIGDENMLVGRYNIERSRAVNKIKGYDFTDKKTNKKMHHDGWAEIVSERMLKKKYLDKKQAKALKENWSVQNKIGEKAYAKFKEINKKLKEASDSKNDALEIINNGDLPKSIYPEIAEVFGFDSRSSNDLAADGEKIWHNGQRIAKRLVKEYTEGNITENSGVFPIKVLASEASGKAAINTYDGDIVPDKNTVFVFGSNTEGRHGKGAAKLAKDKFGAKYGQSEGLQGNSYAIPTKDLKKGTRSVAMKQITQSIKKMYDVARKNPDKEFKVAYRTDNNLSGYKLSEFATMFKYAGDAPDNVVFSKELGALLTKGSGKNKNKYAHKDLPVNGTLLSLLKEAGKNNGQITSDLIAWAAVQSDVTTPYFSKTMKNGVLTYKYDKNYESKLMNYYNPKPEAQEGYVSKGRYYEVSTAGDKEWSAFNAKLKEGTKVLGQDVGGMTIEDAWQKVIKKSGKGKPAAIDSVIMKRIGEATENTPPKPADWGSSVDSNRTFTVEDYQYSLYLATNKLKELEATKAEWKKNGWKKTESGVDVRAKDELGISDLDRINTDIKTQKSLIEQNRQSIIDEGETPWEPGKKVYKNNSGVTKVISGAQTGVDTIGLEIGKELGIETGGTAAPGFYREKGIDSHTADTLKALGVEEISSELQGGKKGKEFYLPRTEENVKNSDGTVYFASDEDTAGKLATERFAKANDKPFIVNPTSRQLNKWISENNIKTLNIAGNRGSKLRDADRVKTVLREAFSGEFGVQDAIDKAYSSSYKELWKAYLDQNPEKAKDLAVKTAGKILTDKFATTRNNQAKALTELLVERGLKDERDLRLLLTHESNKDIAIRVTGDEEGRMGFGERKITDARTGKEITVGEELFDAAKLYGTEYGIVKDSSGNLELTTSESKMDDLEHATEIQTYAALGADYDQKNKVYKPNDFQKRYAESTIDRAKTEMVEFGRFNGKEWFDKMDEINADRSRAIQWGETFGKYEFIDEDGKKHVVNMSAAAFTKALEKDNAVDAFRNYVELLGVRARAGDMDSKLPDDVSADEVSNVTQSIRNLYDTAEYYSNHPKRVEELTPKFDEEGNVLEDQNMPSNRFVNDYGEIIDRNGYGEVSDESIIAHSLGGRAMDLSNEEVTQAIKDYQTFIRWYSDPNDPMYKLIHSKDLEAIRTGRFKAIDSVKKYTKDLNEKAEKLYNRKTKANKEFNALVDSAKMNAELRMKNLSESSSGTKYHYLDALGVAAPESGLNSIGSGGYGQSARRYYAAKAEQSAGVANTDVNVEGWSLDLTKARLTAGESYYAHLMQIAEGYERLQQFSGNNYQKIIDKIRMEAEALPESLKAVRSDFSDNVENSIMAMLGNVYDDARAERVITKDEAEFALRKASQAIMSISSRIFGTEEGLVKKDPTQIASPYAAAMADMVNARDALDKARADGKGVAEAKTNYDNVLLSVYDKFGGEMELGEFMRRVDNNIESFRTAYEYFTDAYANRPTVEGFGTLVPYSKKIGKESMFNTKQLQMAASTAKSGFVADAISFDIPTKKGMRNVEIEIDYGTGQDLSDSGVGARFMNTTIGQEIDPNNFPSEKDADRFFNKAAEALGESSHNVVIKKNPDSSEDVLQEFGYGWYLVARSEDPYEFTRDSFSRGTKQYSAEEVAEKAIADYANRTKDYNPQAEVQKAQKAIDKAKRSYDSNKKKADAAKSSVRKQSIGLEEAAKRVLDDEEFIRFKRDFDAVNEIKENSPAKSNIYRPHDGSYTIISKSDSVPTGCVTAKTLLDGLGYDAKKYNGDISEGRVYTEAEIKADKAARKAMMKEVNENLRSGNVKYTRTQKYKNPSELDLRSQVMTINNLLAFCKQCSERVGMKDKNGKLINIDPSKIVVTKDYADMLFRISREGIGPDTFKAKAKGFALRVTEWNKFIQEFQLAGGASYINALSIAQARGAIFSNPRMTWQYIKLATDYKDDAAVARFAVENSARLIDIAMKCQDHTVFTDFQASASETPGLSDGGTIASMADRVYNALKNRAATERTKEEKYAFSTKAIQDSVDSLFGDATFKRMLPVLRAKMLISNYDNAVRLIRKKFPNIDEDSLNDAACKFAYARTTAFFEPNKTTSGLFKSRKINDVLNTIYDEHLRDSIATWTGAKDEISIGQMTTNCFFAMSYKNRMIQPLVQGMRSLLSPSENMQRRSYLGKQFTDVSDYSISGNEIMSNLGTQFMQRGNRNMIGMVAAISAIAFINAKALGLATSWDDLSFTDENDLDENGNPTFKVPEILKKFQSIGQIWVPNSIDDNGTPTIDPTKPAFKLDPFSSMFTLPNTAWKTIDRTFNSNDYYSAPQRGIGLLGQMTGLNPQGVNDLLNQPLFRAIGDELIGSNLLSPYKAMYEILVDSSYYGNNIWEKRYLPDGSENPNYDPLRNIRASYMHILGLDELLDKDGYNRWVKGYYTNKYKEQDQVGTITGAGILQHEYITMMKQIINGKMIEGIVEGGELPIKKQTLSSTARTEFNTKVKNIIAEYMARYRDVADNTTDIEAKDAAYAKAVKDSANAVAAWSKKYEYVLGRDQRLVPYVTRSMMALLAGEYDDNLDYIQNTYWKASALAQIEASGPSDYWLSDDSLQEWIDSGKTAEEFAAEKNRRTDAYHKALDDEYKARKALHDAGIDNEYLAGMSVQNLKAEQRQINKEVYTGALAKMESPVGEFKNFKEMKSYYESQIDAASSTKQKAKLANQYNTYVTDALAPYVKKYGAAIISDGYYNHDYLSNALAEYIIIPADKYYTGKTPRASYLKDLFGVGYRNKSNLPSDKEVIEGYSQAMKQMVAGYSASSAAILDRVIDAIKRGRLFVSDSDYSKIVRMRALLNARSK